MKRILFISLCLILILSTPLLAGSGGAFLENPVGARAVGMGAAQVASAKDAYAPFWNPAGLAFLEGPAAGSMQSNVFGFIDHKYFSYAQPLKWGTVGVGLVMAGVSGIERGAYVNGRSTLTGDTFDYGAQALLLSAAFSMFQVNRVLELAYLEGLKNKLWVGGNLKLVSETLDSSSASAFGVDLGLIYRYDRQSYFGMNMKNILATSLRWTGGGSGASDTLPLHTVIGIGHRVTPRWLAAFDVDMKAGRGMRYNIGGEYLLYGERDPLDITKVFSSIVNYPEVQRKTEDIGSNYGLFLRGGLSNGAIVMGLGLFYRGFSLDYAYTTAEYDYIGPTQYLSLSYRFTPEKKPKNPRPIKKKPVVKKPEIPIIENVEMIEVERGAPRIIHEEGLHIQPQIIIELPDASAKVVRKRRMGIRGKVFDAKRVFVNGKEAWINPKGFFYQIVDLKKGRNNFVFKAYSRTGDYVKVSRQVISIQ
ncbi:PorV/PorQ family protein [Candidatus Margulisiibacteriota bacterium]